MKLAALGILVLASPVSADKLSVHAEARVSTEVAPVHAVRRQPTTSVVIDRPDGNTIKIASSSVALREVGEDAVLTVDLTVTSRIYLAQRVPVLISLPRGARIVGMSYSAGGTTQIAAHRSAEDARRDFTTVVKSGRDPALLEWTRRTREFDRFKLTMFPITDESPATASLTIALPRSERLIVDIAGTRYESRRGPSDDNDTVVAPKALVDEIHSLYVGPPPE